MIKCVQFTSPYKFDKYCEDKDIKRENIIHLTTHFHWGTVVYVMIYEEEI